MYKFRDYVSSYQEFKNAAKEFPGPISNIPGLEKVNVSDFKSVYEYELSKLDIEKQKLAVLRTMAEFEWYQHKRPYFNVYPLIEKKFYEINVQIDLSELAMPFPAIEVRTTKRTTLMCSAGPDSFLFVVEGNGDEYEEILVRKDVKLEFFLRSDEIRRLDEFWPVAGSSSISIEEANSLVFLAAGVCMLARDASVVCPVLLNKHRKDGMTPAEIAKYAEKAVARSGRTGFDVGRDIERMKATAHYRNGCFAKYYVTKNHENYPPNAEAQKVPIIKWRCGSLVNKDNVPKVPTGFKDMIPSDV